MPTVTVTCAGETATATYGLNPVPPIPAPSVPGTRYTTPALLQDFNGPLDPAIWNTALHDGVSLPYDMAVIRNARNVSVRDGCLVLAARREVDGARGWTSAYISTEGRWVQPGGFGVYEVRAKLPTTAGDSAGLWPAPLWLRAVNSKLEIDVCEAWGEPITGNPPWRFTPGAVSSTVMADTNTHTPKVDAWYPPPTGGRLSDDFHTFAYEVSPDGVRQCLDGRVLRAWTTAQLKTAGIDLAVLIGDLTLRVNFQVGQPSYYGPPDAQTKSYAETLVEFIRVWR